MKNILKLGIVTSLVTTALFAQSPKCPFGFNYKGTQDLFCGQYFRTNWSGFEGSYATWHWEKWKESKDKFDEDYKEHRLAKLIWSLKNIDLSKQQIIDIMSLKASFCLEFDRFSKTETDKKVLLNHVIKLENVYIPKVKYILTSEQKKLLNI